MKLWHFFALTFALTFALGFVLTFALSGSSSDIQDRFKEWEGLVSYTDEYFGILDYELGKFFQNQGDYEPDLDNIPEFGNMKQLLRNCVEASTNFKAAYSDFEDSISTLKSQWDLESKYGRHHKRFKK